MAKILQRETKCTLGTSIITLSIKNAKKASLLLSSTNPFREAYADDLFFSLVDDDSLCEYAFHSPEKIKMYKYVHRHNPDTFFINRGIRQPLFPMNTDEVLDAFFKYMKVFNGCKVKKEGSFFHPASEVFQSRKLTKGAKLCAVYSNSSIDVHGLPDFLLDYVVVHYELPSCYGVMLVEPYYLACPERDLSPQDVFLKTEALTGGLSDDSRFPARSIITLVVDKQGTDPIYCYKEE